MTSETVFQRNFNNDDNTGSAQRSLDTIVESSSSVSLPQSQAPKQNYARPQALISASENASTHNNDSATEIEMSKRLELLERRFIEPPHHIARNSNDSSGGSHHSFTFDQPSNAVLRSSSMPRPQSQTPGNRSSKARKRRTSTASPSTQILENVADQHMKKVSRTLASKSRSRYASHDTSVRVQVHPGHPTSRSRSASTSSINNSLPGYNPVFSPASASASASASANSNNRSHSMSSNQTLITAHVTKRNDNGHSLSSAPAMEVVVAESPPVTNEDISMSLNRPGSFARNGAIPRVARSILGEADPPTTPSSNKSTTISPTPSKSSKKRKNVAPTRLVEKKKQRNLKFHDHPKKETHNSSKNSNGPSLSSGMRSGARITATVPITPIVSSVTAPDVMIENILPSSARSSSSAIAGTKDQNNGSAQIAVGGQKSAANMLITKFFSMSKSTKKKPSKPSSKLPQSNEDTSCTNNSANENFHSQINMKLPLEIIPRTNNDLHKQIAMLKANIEELNESLNEKTSQLKAVSNNQTIIHTRLKKALQERDEELKSLKVESVQKNEKLCNALEAFIRKESVRQHAELRQKLASGGTRLGRWVYNWTGMRRETVWEDGQALQACQKKRKEMKRKRDVLENRLKEGSKHLGDLDAMEQEEFGQSISIHLDELERAEIELKKEEESLAAEKNAHKLALKQVTNEDYSKFKSNPKVGSNACEIFTNAFLLEHCLIKNLFYFFVAQ